MASLNAFLKDADERVRKAAADALNEAAEQVQQQIESNMDAQGIQNRTGQLRRSIKVTKATPKRLSCRISSEVFVAAPKKPGSRNPAMRGRYKYGVPYGRLIEFSPRINKPFFYKAWYKLRNRVKNEVMEAIGDAWNG